MKKKIINCGAQSDAVAMGRATSTVTSAVES
jgi:hypothetical protein